MGENGAGKSTLIKAITGALPLDAGVLIARRRARALRLAARRAARGHQHGLPGDRPAAEPVGRREHLAGPRAAPARVASTGRRCATSARATLADLGLDIDPASMLGTPLARGAAARRDRARHLDRRARARARRADLEPRPRRGGRALPGHPRPASSAASRSCSSRTSSTRSTSSATASRCCATASSSAST